jgi:NSS family neurotransmitter:Na+ symporter
LGWDDKRGIDGGKAGGGDSIRLLAAGRAMRTLSVTELEAGMAERMGYRGSWGSRIGFVLAAAGSAVGLGNVWKFPYMAGENGGGAFLILYLGIAFTIGISVMLGEFVIGRAAERNPVGAFAQLKGGAWKIAGGLGVAAGFLILSFYSVVAGWTIAYVVKSASGALATTDAAALGAAFGAFSGAVVEPILYHALFMAMTIGVVLFGVHGGIERVCKILLPALFIILCVLAIRSLTLPGAWEGIRFFLAPDFSKVTTATLNGALAQAFFSLSVGMGAMITYGSYLSPKENLPKATLQVTLFDTLIAVIAGLVILPAVFAFGISPAAGPKLVFITLPAVFAQMPGGTFFAVLFFVLLVIAALTSAVSLLEVVVAYFVDERGMKRKTVSVLAGGTIFLLGVPSSLSMGVWGRYKIAGKEFLSLMDYIGSNLMLPLGGIAVSLFIGWAILPRALEEATSRGGHAFRLAPAWVFICRWVAPIAIGWILFKGL